MFFIEGHNPNKDKEQCGDEDAYRLLMVDTRDKEYLKRLGSIISNPPQQEAICFRSNLAGDCDTGKDVDNTKDTASKNCAVYFLTTDSEQGKLLLHKIYTAIEEWRSEVDVPLVAHCTEGSSIQLGPSRVVPAHLSIRLGNRNNSHDS